MTVCEPKLPPSPVPDPSAALVAARAVLRRLATRRVLLLAVLTVAFAALSWAVLVGKPFGVIDHRGQSLHTHVTGYRHLLQRYVLLGQRGPTCAVALVWFVVLSLIRRTPDSLMLFGVGELGNNLLVGVVKLATGRWGPAATTNVHDILAGGDIFPSGHVSNAVVLFGVLTVTAGRWRRGLTLLSIWVAGSVGVATVLLDTHWITDVVGGWLAGSIVLLCLPSHDGLTRRILRMPGRLVAIVRPAPEPTAPEPGGVAVFEEADAA